MGFDASNLAFFVAVARDGSFAAASRRLGQPTTTTSRRIAELEESLGVRLFYRTTRHVSLTDAGRLYLERIAPVVQAIDEANRLLSHAQTHVEGQLRITAPYLLGEAFVMDWVLAFQARYPQVRVELQLDNHFLSLPATGIDLAIRAGSLDDSSLIARHLFDAGRLLVASPDFLRDRETPEHPESLAQWPAITTSIQPEPVVWALQRADASVRLHPASHLHLNDLRLALRALLAGHGIALMPEFLVRPHLDRGELLTILPEWRGPTAPIHLIYHGKRLLTLAQQVFIDFVLSQANRLQPDR